ncbi:MAG: hypothetical protein ACW98Y_09535 [Candidatus Thorarchaeota archaeon]|jgi:hypothetical protein
MVSKKYDKRVNIPLGLADEIDDLIQSKPELRYRSRAHFVRTSLQETLLLLKSGIPSAFMDRWSGTPSDFILRLMEGVETIHGREIERGVLEAQASRQGMPEELTTKTIDALLNNGLIFSLREGFLRRTPSDRKPSESKTQTKHLIKLEAETSPEIARPFQLMFALRERLGEPDYMSGEGGALLCVWYQYRFTMLNTIQRLGYPLKDSFIIDCPPLLLPMLAEVFEDVAERVGDYTNNWRALMEKISKNNQDRRTDLI